MRGDGNSESPKVPFARSRISRRARWVPPHRAPFARMAPRNLRKKKADSDSDEDDPQTLQERIDDARTLIKSRAKAKVRPNPKPSLFASATP